MQRAQYFIKMKYFGIYLIVIFLVNGCCYVPLVDCFPQRSQLTVDYLSKPWCSGLDNFSAVSLKRTGWKTEHKVLVYIPTNDSVILSEVRGEIINDSPLRADKIMYEGTKGKYLVFADYSDDQYVFTITLDDVRLSKGQSIFLDLLFMSVVDSAKNCRMEVEVLSSD